MLGGWPLPAAGGQPWALHLGPTKPVLCSRFREHLEGCFASWFDAKRPFRCPPGASPLKRERLGAETAPSPSSRTRLLEFDLGAGFFQLLLGSFGVGLGNAFLHRLRSAVDQVLGFLEAQ